MLLELAADLAGPAPGARGHVPHERGAELHGRREARGRRGEGRERPLEERPPGRGGERGLLLEHAVRAAAGVDRSDQGEHLLRALGDVQHRQEQTLGLRGGAAFVGSSLGVERRARSRTSHTWRGLGRRARRAMPRKPKRRAERLQGRGRLPLAHGEAQRRRPLALVEPEDARSGLLGEQRAAPDGAQGLRQEAEQPAEPHAQAEGRHAPLQEQVALLLLPGGQPRVVQVPHPGPALGRRGGRRARRQLRQVGAALLRGGRRARQAARLAGQPDPPDAAGVQQHEGPVGLDAHIQDRRVEAHDGVELQGARRPDGALEAVHARGDADLRGRVL